MNKKKIIALVIVLVLVVGFISLFPRKVKFQETITACTYEGETISAEFDVELWKYWYMMDVMKGSVTVNGVVYEHMEYKKYGSEFRDFMFAVPKGDMLDRLDNSLNVSLYGEDFEAFILVTINDGESTMYIGPASNMDEIKEMETLIFEE